VAPGAHFLMAHKATLGVTVRLQHTDGPLTTGLERFYRVEPGGQVDLGERVSKR
jgi:hypothetical protein